MANLENISKVPVSLGERSYDILVGEHLLAQAGAIIKPMLARPFVVIMTDDVVAEHHLEALQKSLSSVDIEHTTLTLPAGEATKNFSNLEDMLESMIRLGVERSDTIIALGGGVIGDLTGFVSAILRRGTNFIQIPTTLLAQVDSSVGGKTAINSAQGKNLIGAFHQPQLVLADVNVLNTLPARHLLAGYAEVLKYGLLGDKDFFDWLNEQGLALVEGDVSARIKGVVTSCEAKAAIVAADEREAGQRALLNLGHTFGHALEAAVGYDDRLLHGEGVAIGMAMAFQFSTELGLCSAEDTEKAVAHMIALGLPTKVSDIPDFSVTAEEMLGHMLQDKKVVAGTVTLILVRGIGQAFITREISEQQLLNFLTRTVVV